MTGKRHANVRKTLLLQLSNCAMRKTKLYYAPTYEQIKHAGVTKIREQSLRRICYTLHKSGCLWSLTFVFGKDEYRSPLAGTYYEEPKIKCNISQNSVVRSLDFCISQDFKASYLSNVAVKILSKNSGEELAPFEKSVIMP